MLALLSAVLAATYARVLAKPPRQIRAMVGLVLMVGLTFFDYSLARRLRRAETP